MSWTIPGGDHKGTPLDQASESDLKFWIKRTEDGLAKDPNGKWAAKNQQWLTAARTVRAKRSGPQSAQQQPPTRPQQTQAITRAHPDSVTVVGQALASAATVTAALREQSQVAHLVTPSPACGSLPEGCEVAISMGHVDPNESGGEGYPVAGGKLGLAKVAL